MIRVFVYGSLLKGFGNHRLLRNATFVGEAKTTAEYTMISRGGFPGVFPGGHTEILGELYDVDEETAKRLDWLEGVDYKDPHNGHYRKEEITLAGGEKAFIYFINEHCQTGPVIESGSWREFTKERVRYV